MSGKRYDVLLRLLLVGDTGVGKTCLICQYANNEFYDTHISTIGIDFKMKTVNINGSIVKVQIWDTAGQERFESITKQFYRRAQGVMLVYDICSRSTFDSLPKWLSYVRQFSKEDTMITILGNKHDMEDKRQVEYLEGQQFAAKNNLKFFETSAKDRENLQKPFHDMCDAIISMQEAKSSSETLSDPSTPTVAVGNSVVQSNQTDRTQLIGDSSDSEDEEQKVELKFNSLRKWACCGIL
ncbi:ras-related protein Rab-10 [Patella vulgata]|uniref:ras-related protein Rab-10 n=1 Tax=Patella vulgata TaxID=6465 RepID=UPI0021801326|nr:ras-related protein Rab-10 [Patella vulgata]